MDGDFVRALVQALMRVLADGSADSMLLHLLHALVKKKTLACDLFCQRVVTVHGSLPSSGT